MRFLLAALIFLALPSAAAFAQDNNAGQQQPAVTEQQQAVQAVGNYLNGITTLRARFVQTASDGKKMTGTFYLNRPGKMRIDYDPPVKDFIVADGFLIYYYDGKMKQQSSAPISHSLADFFLRKDLKLSGEISVSDIKRENNTLQMTLVQTRNPLAGSLTLIFGENPLQLQKWRIVDEQGLVTEVQLSNIETGIAIDSALFHYYDPAHETHLYNGN